MKRRLFIVVTIVISLALLMSGCLSKTYLFDFTVEPDLARADGEWATASAEYIFTPDGLILKNNWAAVPHLYNGDFDVEYKFK